MRAPVLAIGDGALGFWAAVREVWPETAEQRCWVHRIANVLDKLPKSLQPRAKQALHAMLYAETRTLCEREIRRFIAEYAPKYPKAVAGLLTLFDYPAEQGKHLRTTNPIESTFATVRLRERVTKGAGSRTAGLTMAFKLLEAAQAHWRRLDSADLIRWCERAFASSTEYALSGKRSARRAPPDLLRSTTLDNSSPCHDSFASSPLVQEASADPRWVPQQWFTVRRSLRVPRVA
jgi:transposase-like protein